ncbi:MAG TPA: helix-turn-helix domain-containing protein [Cytophagaceae bacterium]|jgi:AraC-like DNA-binding protein
MDFKTADPDNSISLFVKNILIFEEHEPNLETVLPFYADGYPGLIFHETINGLLVRPHQKLMPSFFLYGQTLKPIELILNGPFKLIVFQLFPFVLKSLFDVEAKDLNDNCYDLAQFERSLTAGTLTELNKIKSTQERVNTLTLFLPILLKNKQERLDLTVASAIHKILSAKGKLVIGSLCRELNLTERTFERRFMNSVGVTAKQFSKIIQFQQSLEQLTSKDYTKLTDVVYANGYSDQSHFIKVFKSFTGKTPLVFRAQS